MAVILSFETSTDVCSVALHDNGMLLAEAVVQEAQVHASRLAPMIRDLIRTISLKESDIEAVAITSGPGSYTGLRIGTSTAKGFCIALNIPLLAVGTLELLAYQATPFNSSQALLCPMIDARRMEVYTMVVDNQLQMVQPVGAMLIDSGSFAELLEQSPMLFMGNGSAKCREVLTHHNALFLDDVYPTASALGEMAFERLQAGKTEDLIAFKPFYLKEFVAKTSQRSL